MELPPIVSREEWQQSHDGLLAKEKEATRARDALAAERRRQPMTEFAPDYGSRGPTGEVSLLDLFEGRSQLLVYHFWLPPGGSSLPRLLDVHRPGQPARPPQRARHVVGARLRRPSGRDREGQGPQRLDGPLVHDRRTRVPGGLWDLGVLRARRVPARRRPGVPHLRDEEPWRRGAGQHLDLPRPDAARAPGGVGGHAARAPADAGLLVVASPGSSTRRLTRSPVRAFQCQWTCTGPSSTARSGR